jgi:hypothetical protein
MYYISSKNNYVVFATELITNDSVKVRPTAVLKLIIASRQFDVRLFINACSQELMLSQRRIVEDRCHVMTSRLRERIHGDPAILL